MAGIVSLKDAVQDNMDEQRELFLYKFRDVTRESINEEFKYFVKHDLRHCGELDEHEALMLLEHKNMTKTATELRTLLADIDKNKDRRVNFLEWCCFVYAKPWEELNNFVDEEARARAMAECKAAGQKARAVEAAIQKAKELEEEKAAKRAKELEEEAKLTGVKGAAAFFKRAGEGTGDSTMSNKDRITQEAARRKELREAKAAEERARNEANKVKSAEEIAEEVAKRAREVAAAEAAAAEAAAAKEKADRLARKKALNERFNASKSP